MNEQQARLAAWIAAALLITACMPSSAWGYYVRAEGNAHARASYGADLTDSQDTGQLTALRECK